MSFLSDDLMKGTDWRALERAVARLMSHCGWRDVSIIGKTGDMGGDIIAVRDDKTGSKTWVVQVKAITGGNYVGKTGVDEVLKAQSIYGANVAVLATNGDFTDSVEKRKNELIKVGFDFKIWNGKFLQNILDKWPEFGYSYKKKREYQNIVIEKSLNIFNSGGQKVQYVVATGLGKTLIAAEIVSKLWNSGFKKILVLCHAQDLALQLEQSFWSQLSKNTPTRYFFDGTPPLIYEGVNFGLYQSMRNYLSSITSNSYDVLVIDEAHHALAHDFRTCIDHLEHSLLIGMTATPWRGDGSTIDKLFGEPIARYSLVDGMKMGFLAQVDYKLYCDNLDWNKIPECSKQNLTIKDLNKKLFLPQRDDAIINEIIAVSQKLEKPRIAIFSPSIEHAKRFSAVLSSRGISCAALSGDDKINRRKNLMNFSTGKIIAVTSVDVMNEGIDVPEVNVLVFLRATHSRRIFVQQLGRGLRLAPDKDKVIVLDFVSDIRRMAEIISFERETKIKKDNFESIYIKNSTIEFNDLKAKKFIEEWLNDVTDLADSSDNEKLKFPEIN